VVASHTTAAVRIARSRATPTPTPVATAQTTASTQEERRSAGTGGVALRRPLHAGVRRRCVIRPARTPQARDKTFQLNALASGT
jgi:hypothetical protein